MGLRKFWKILPGNTPIRPKICRSALELALEAIGGEARGDWEKWRWPGGGTEAWPEKPRRTTGMPLFPSHLFDAGRTTL